MPVKAEPCCRCQEISEFMLHHEPSNTWRCLYCLNAETEGDQERGGDQSIRMQRPCPS
jgi:hypothetical protein